MSKLETYLSIDIESDGPCPGVHSMLSLGVVAFDSAGQELDTYYANLELLEGAKVDPDTAAWWAQRPEVYAATRMQLQTPAIAMLGFDSWVRSFPAPYVAVAYPAGFDFTWVYWYLHRYVGKSVLGFQALDLKTYAMALMGSTFRAATKRNMPKAWFKGTAKHTHHALDDARGQGQLYFNMRRVAQAR